MSDPIIIFGGSGGIGFALASRLVAQGKPVFLASRNAARLAECSRKLTNAPFGICDVTNSEAVSAVVERAAVDGRLGGIAYCVGSIVLKPLKRATAADFTAAFALNVLGAALSIQAAEGALRRSPGASVVLFSTVAVGSGFPNHSVIAAAKGAVEGLCRALAAEFAPEIRVNCIAPSLVRTPLAAAITANDAMAKSIASLHPMARLGEADDIAAMAAHLLGEDASWVTGQVIAVDGGRSSLRTKG